MKILFFWLFLFCFSSIGMCDQYEDILQRKLYNECAASYREYFPLKNTIPKIKNINIYYAGCIGDENTNFCIHKININVKYLKKCFTGELKYININKVIIIRGCIDSEGSICLCEAVDNKTKVLFKGRYKGDTIKGLWSNPQETVMYPMYVKVVEE